MSNNDKKDSKNFASNLFEFLEEAETPGETTELEEELRANGIDPDTEMRWVDQYVKQQLRELKAHRIQAVSESRIALLDGLNALKKRGSVELASIVDNLLNQVQNAQPIGMEAIQAQFSKLENPTEEDLRSLLGDWVELEHWGDNIADKETE